MARPDARPTTGRDRDRARRRWPSTDTGTFTARVAAETTDPYERAEALIIRLAVLVNQGKKDELAAASDAAFTALAEVDFPDLAGRLHALAAIVAHQEGSLERCVEHLVRGNRALTGVGENRPDIAWAWHNLATSYSYAGFHHQAIAALESARKIGEAAGAAEEILAAPAIRLRYALWLDHRADTDACVTALKEIIAEWRQRFHDGKQLRRLDEGHYGYAMARLAALGHPTGLDARRYLVAAGESVRGRDLRVLGDACLAIAEGRPAEAITALEAASVSPDTLHPAEIPRLCAMAYLAVGNDATAYAADREATRLATAAVGGMRDLCVDGFAARLDRDELHRTVARYAGEAFTDPLTGLANRRHLERYVDDLVARGEKAVLGVCDMDGFKAVNTVHGHLAGDMVLQRVASTITRVMRDGDFVARYGGDEFVVVLPATGMREAYDVAHRVVVAVRNEDWNSLVPGTPVGVSVGWAEIDGPGSVSHAFEAADRAMLNAKHEAKSARAS